jgi:polyphosphate kinase
MKKQFLAHRQRSLQRAQPARRRRVKVNGLDDKAMTAKLYEASQNGVRVDCIVRGVCRLRPGIPGVSDNIRVVSVIGRFLEHHRVYMFFNGGDPLYYVGSADWMKRNLQQRVEVAAPITRSNSRDRLRELLGLSLSDAGAWEMLPDGTYRRPATRTDEAHLSAPLLNQPAFSDAMMDRLHTSGLQGTLMNAILVKIENTRRMALC